MSTIFVSFNLSNMINKLFFKQLKKYNFWNYQMVIIRLFLNQNYRLSFMIFLSELAFYNESNFLFINLLTIVLTLHLHVLIELTYDTIPMQWFYFARVLMTNSLWERHFLSILTKFQYSLIL